MPDLQQVLTEGPVSGEHLRRPEGERNPALISPSLPVGKHGADGSVWPPDVLLRQLGAPSRSDLQLRLFPDVRGRGAVGRRRRRRKRCPQVFVHPTELEGPQLDRGRRRQHCRRLVGYCPISSGYADSGRPLQSPHQGTTATVGHPVLGPYRCPVDDSGPDHSSLPRRVGGFPILLHRCSEEGRTRPPPPSSLPRFGQEFRPDPVRDAIFLVAARSSSCVTCSSPLRSVDVVAAVAVDDISPLPEERDGPDRPPSLP
jgi:hypothetical protein